MSKKICMITASDMTIKAFLRDQIKDLNSIYEVTVAVNTKNINFLKEIGIDVPVKIIHIERKISIKSDIKALLQLIKFFKKSDFDLIHSVTPKAGLLSMIAGRIAGVPIRLHTFTGQVWATRKGISRSVLKAMDSLIGIFATNILVDSPSQRDFLINNKIIKPGKSTVLADGSISGVDINRFKFELQKRIEMRKKLELKENNIVFLFVGRLNRDKGILDLVEAFSILEKNTKNINLLLVGIDEGNIKSEIISKYKEQIAKIKFIEFTDEPENYMLASDVFCLPSYREGFGNVIIEAASCGIPAIGSRIYGITDAIEENVTGLLFKAGNVDELVEKMEMLASDVKLREIYGDNAMRRATTKFPQDKITKALIKHYEDLLK